MTGSVQKLKDDDSLISLSSRDCRHPHVLPPGVPYRGPGRVQYVARNLVHCVEARHRETYSLHTRNSPRRRPKPRSSISAVQGWKWPAETSDVLLHRAGHSRGGRRRGCFAADIFVLEKCRLRRIRQEGVEGRWQAQSGWRLQARPGTNAESWQAQSCLRVGSQAFFIRRREMGDGGELEPLLR